MVCFISTSIRKRTLTVRSGVRFSSIRSTKRLSLSANITWISSIASPTPPVWTNEITGCGVAINCISARRISVSASFFFSPEFQQSGFFVYRVRKASLGAQPTYNQYLVDRNQLISPSETDKTSFAQAFVQRGEFLSVYPTSMNGSDFIDKF